MSLDPFATTSYFGDTLQMATAIGVLLTGISSLRHGKTLKSTKEDVSQTKALVDQVQDQVNDTRSTVLDTKQVVEEVHGTCAETVQEEQEKHPAHDAQVQQDHQLKQAAHPHPPTSSGPGSTQYHPDWWR